MTDAGEEAAQLLLDTARWHLEEGGEWLPQVVLLRDGRQVAAAISPGLHENRTEVEVCTEWALLIGAYTPDTVLVAIDAVMLIGKPEDLSGQPRPRENPASVDALVIYEVKLTAARVWNYVYHRQDDGRLQWEDVRQARSPAIQSQWVRLLQVGLRASHLNRNLSPHRDSVRHFLTAAGHVLFIMEGESDVR